jgi:hypothetical protein
LVKVIRLTVFAWSARYFSIAFWVSARLPATVDGAERTVIRLVTEEAERLREFIRSHPPPDDPT